MSGSKKFQYVIPIFNEEDCVEEIVTRLDKVRNTLSDFQFEAIFVNDGSKDSTLEKIFQLRSRHPWVRVINLTRNFGHQIALTAGLDHADGDYICIIDGDLQDPPELAIEMLETMKKNRAHVVYGQRTLRKGETFFKKWSASFFYAVIDRLCDIEIPRNTGDFRLITKTVLLSFQKLREKHRFIRGMIPWLGYKMVPFPYERDRRFAGETKYPLGKMITFAMDAVSSFSNKPLRSAYYIGALIVLVGLLGGFYMLYLKLFTTIVVPGLTAILLTQIILGGFQIFMLGLIGEYVGKVFEESKHRPLYTIDQDHE